MQDSHSFFNVLQQYFADSALLPLFVIALVWIVKKWKPEYKRIIVAMALGSILVFNELIYRVFVIAGEGITYYRLLWIIPIVFIVAIFIVECVTRLRKDMQIVVACIFLLAVVMFSEQITSEKLSLPDNIYQVDKDVIQVADKVMELSNGERAYLLDNGGLDMAIRQYDARIVYTDNEEYGLWAVIEGESKNVLGSDIIQATYDDRSKYLALRKDEPLAHRLVESAGHAQIASTDNYLIYCVDYDRVYWDWEKRTLMSEGNVGQMTMEYVPVTGVDERFGYVYLSDFGDVENESVYQELFSKIRALQPEGLIINDQLSVNAGWYVDYADQLGELMIPYYCNNQEFQTIEQDKVIICMMDNRNGISKETLEKFKELEKKGKPVIVVLSVKVEDIADEFSKFVTDTDFVVQILSAQKGGYSKELFGEKRLQYATPVDENQILNILYLKDLKVVLD